ncbi:hypothetical protein IPN35_04865 [Candidatus Peregrinibacteria bacterium]|nr:MAG: hypothetical protein IPN35_04865 [Candidatus Peregrinibacteria bacterium]
MSMIGSHGMVAPFFNFYFFMKKISFVLFAISLALFGDKTALAMNVDSVSTESVSYGAPFAIHGSGFGALNEYSQICWGGVCISNKNIEIWSDSRVIFRFTTIGMPYSGQMTISNGYETAIVGNVAVQPMIDDVYIDGKVTDYIKKGQTVTITGVYLGQDDGISELRLNNTMVGLVDVWQDNKIVFKAENDSPIDIMLKNSALETTNYSRQKCGNNTTVDNSGSCICMEGYVWQSNDSNVLNCVLIEVQNSCGEHASLVNDNNCRCDEGYVWKSNDPKNTDCIKIEKIDEKLEEEVNNEDPTQTLINQDLELYDFDNLRFKKIEDFKVLAKKTKKGVILMLWKPNTNIASQIKEYEVDILDEDGEEQPIILHKKKLLLFKPKSGSIYTIQIRGLDKNDNVVAESVFSAKE